MGLVIKLDDITFKQNHTKRCLEVLYDVYKDNRIPGRLRHTILNHDIGYSRDCYYEGCLDHNINGYMLAKDSKVVNARAILLHGKLNSVDLYTKDVDLLETYIVDYCDIHSGPNGEVFTLQDRYEEIKQRYGEDSPVYKGMLERESYYLTLFHHIDGVVESHVRITQ